MKWNPWGLSIDEVIVEGGAGIVVVVVVGVLVEHVCGYERAQQLHCLFRINCESQPSLQDIRQNRAINERVAIASVFYEIANGRVDRARRP